MFRSLKLAGSNEIIESGDTRTEVRAPAFVLVFFCLRPFSEMKNPAVELPGFVKQIFEFGFYTGAGAGFPSPGGSFGEDGLGVSGSGVPAGAPCGGSTFGGGGGAVNLPV